MRVCQCLSDDLQYGIGFVQHLVIPEAQHTPAVQLQKLGALLVVRQTIAMGVLAAVELNNEVGWHAGKVGKVGASGVLAAEFVAGKLLRAQVVPEQALGVGGLLAQGAGILRPHPSPLPHAGEGATPRTITKLRSARRSLSRLRVRMGVRAPRSRPLSRRQERARVRVATSMGRCARTGPLTPTLSPTGARE